ncbi:hypothetical protein Q0N14_00425 [Francisella tularensis subsp. mediasiatica]|uniref:hypothetical protein n=1 Tax=Francisella tularensis TaxID=263 RepID=UPI00030ADAC8|nr:hypothetical protein [Francisella tularensis]MDN9002480.1 hypothetical protein [Francisella tularensis subsp. mediasiatica]WKL74145.1 hypothetical protein Q1H01_00425 [Francisella tularensis subsp. mediasiatica]WKL75049.1 hypothetical protein Q1H00_05815 [Francisella tularensis subsp. mediasiatica]
MKKLIVTSTFITALVSVSYATELKGSDYISTEVGSTYNYQRVNADDKDKFTIETTIKVVIMLKLHVIMSAKSKMSTVKLVLIQATNIAMLLVLMALFI